MNIKLDKINYINIKFMRYSSLIMISVLALAASSYAQAPTQSMPLYKNAVPEATLKEYPILSYNFIDLIRIIPKPLPASLEKFQKIFNNQFSINEKDEDSVMYMAGPFRTLDGVIIKKIRVFASLKSETSIRKLGLDLDQKQCVNSRLLKKEFGFVILDILSFHPTPNAPIAFYTTDEWGEFILYATMDYPDCAEGIGMWTFVNKKLQQEWIEHVHKQIASYKESNDKESK